MKNIRIIFFIAAIVQSTGLYLNAFIFKNIYALLAWGFVLIFTGLMINCCKE